jgi:DNA-binding MarR family transcriptional regulator
MLKELELRNVALRTWVLEQRTRELLRKCEDKVLGEYNITTEQYLTLIAIEYLDDPVRPTDVARWMLRKGNSASMIIDRMVKAGLVRRVRDRHDRRVVRVVITSKGRATFEQVTPVYWGLVEQILSSLSYEDKHTLISLLERLRDTAFEYLNPERDIREINRYEIEDMARFMKRMTRYISTSAKLKELELRNVALRTWVLAQRTRDLLRKCEDKVLGEYNITTEQCTALIAIEYLDDPVRPTDIARWMLRKGTSASMIIDRMVKAGLVRRVRDRHDRRVVRLVITSKGRETLEQATPAFWGLIEETLSSLSYEDKHTLISLLEGLRDTAFEYLNPERDIREISRYEIEDMARFMKRMTRYISSSTS